LAKLKTPFFWNKAAHSQSKNEERPDAGFSNVELPKNPYLLTQIS